MCYKPKEILGWFCFLNGSIVQDVGTHLALKYREKKFLNCHHSFLSFFLYLQLRYTASFVPTVFSTLSRKTNTQISLESKHDFWSHLCKSSYNSREISSGTPAFHLCKWHQKLCCANLLEREVIYIEDCLVSPFFSSCNLHVCLWIYKALMEGAETARQLVRRDPLQRHIQLGQWNLSMWHLLVTHSGTVHHPL